MCKLKDVQWLDAAANLGGKQIIIEQHCGWRCRLTARRSQVQLPSGESLGGSLFTHKHQNRRCGTNIQSVSSTRCTCAALHLAPRGRTAATAPSRRMGNKLKGKRKVSSRIVSDVTDQVLLLLHPLYPLFLLHINFLICDISDIAAADLPKQLQILIK